MPTFTAAQRPVEHSHSFRFKVRRYMYFGGPVDARDASSLGAKPLRRWNHLLGNNDLKLVVVMRDGLQNTYPRCSHIVLAGNNRHLEQVGLERASGDLPEVRCHGFWVGFNCASQRYKFQVLLETGQDLRLLLNILLAAGCPTTAPVSKCRPVDPNAGLRAPPGNHDVQQTYELAARATAPGSSPAEPELATVNGAVVLAVTTYSRSLSYGKPKTLVAGPTVVKWEHLAPTSGLTLAVRQDAPGLEMKLFRHSILLRHLTKFTGHLVCFGASVAFKYRAGNRKCAVQLQFSPESMSRFIKFCEQRKIKLVISTRCPSCTGTTVLANSSLVQTHSASSWSRQA